MMSKNSHIAYVENDGNIVASRAIHAYINQKFYIVSITVGTISQTAGNMSTVVGPVVLHKVFLYVTKAQ